MGENVQRIVVDRWLKEEDNRRILRLRKAGNAFAVTLPKKWLKELGWKGTDYVLVERVLDKIVISRARVEGL